MGPMSKILQGMEFYFKERPGDVLGVVARHKLALIASNSALRTPTSRRFGLHRQMGKIKKNASTGNRTRVLTLGRINHNH